MLNTGNVVGSKAYQPRQGLVEGDRKMIGDRGDMAVREHGVRQREPISQSSWS